MLAEQAGFDGIVVSEHFHPWVDDAAPQSGFAFSTIGAIARSDRAGANRHRRDNPALSIPPRCRGAGRRDPRPPVERPLRSRGRHWREHQRGAARLRVPGLCGTRRPHEGSPRDHARAARRREALVRRASTTGPIEPACTALRLGGVPIWMAAGGPEVGGARRPEKAEGIITSVKDPETTFERVITPAREAAAAAGRNPNRSILATRWAIHAEDRGRGLGGAQVVAWSTSARPARGGRSPDPAGTGR